MGFGNQEVCFTQAKFQQQKITKGHNFSRQLQKEILEILESPKSVLVPSQLQNKNPSQA
ncbi:hypothetical protein [Helicobacter enhydrae]|uniref:hypothetical protein n=1 Tax=Helicobacter enhydrae TaxID=222136 RepID=UPI0018FFDEF3|nr:hypothetical protein [Helicobacter enhydrae]